MKLIIAGSRDFVPEESDYIFLLNIIEENKVVEIVSGGASGADKFGELVAEENGIPVKLFPADWKKWGKSAGPRRNREMAEYADALCAFWDGSSRGTKNMIEEAKSRGLQIYLKVKQK